MRKINLNKLQKNSRSSFTYLKKVEKAYFKKNINTLSEKREFSVFIKENHTSEEIKLMTNEIEQHFSNTAELIKIIFTSIIALIVALLSFMAVIISVVINMKFQLDMGLMDQLVQVSPNFRYLLYDFIYFWIASYTLITMVAILLMKMVQRRKIVFLAILKSIS